jgi:hypothetical protein
MAMTAAAHSFPDMSDKFGRPATRHRFHQDHAGQPKAGGFIREDTHHAGSSVYFAVEPLQAVGDAQLALGLVGG